MICVFLTELGYASHDNYRTEHGRKELLYQTSVQLLDTATLCGLSKLSVGCLDLYHGSDWVLCACKVGHSWHAGCCVHTVYTQWISESSVCASVLPGEYCVLRMGASDWMFAGKSTFMVELMVRNQFVDFTSFSYKQNLFRRPQR